MGQNSYTFASWGCCGAVYQTTQLRIVVLIFEYNISLGLLYIQFTFDC